MLQHAAFELLQPRRWLDPELVAKGPPETLKRLECFRVPAAAVKGKHLLPAESLPQRVAVDESVELADEVGVAAELEVGVDALLEADELLLFESRRLAELRLVALEGRIDADLELGRHAELVGELEALVVEHPLR